MSKGPIRRAQLIAPFGPATMTIMPDGTSLMGAGVDHWYEHEDGSAGVDVAEYMVEEWRLQHLLNVGHFRLPPDYRAPWRFGAATTPNRDLTIPHLRFPQFHFCVRCKRLSKVSLFVRGRLKCTHCQGEGRLAFMPKFLSSRCVSTGTCVTSRGVSGCTTVAIPTAPCSCT